MAEGGAVLVVTQADYSDWGWGRWGRWCLRGYPGQEVAGRSTAQEEGRELTGSS